MEEEIGRKRGKNREKMEKRREKWKNGVGFSSKEAKMETVGASREENFGEIWNGTQSTGALQFAEICLKSCWIWIFFSFHFLE